MRSGTDAQADPSSVATSRTSSNSSGKRARSRSPSLEIIGGPYGDGLPPSSCAVCGTAWHRLGLAHDMQGQADHLDACMLDLHDRSEPVASSSKRARHSPSDFSRLDARPDDVDGCPCCGRAWTDKEPPHGSARPMHVEACLRQGADDFAAEDGLEEIDYEAEDDVSVVLSGEGGHTEGKARASIDEMSAR